MPKVTWFKTPVQVNHLAAVFRAYRKASGKTSAQIGKELGCTAENARAQMNKPGKDWNIGMLMKYCDVLGIPYDEALAAAARK